MPTDDDYVGVYLVTFHDGRRAYEFACNPLGVQNDSLYSEDSDSADVAFDTVWDSHGKLTTRGYVSCSVSRSRACASVTARIRHGISPCREHSGDARKSRGGPESTRKSGESSVKRQPPTGSRILRPDAICSCFLTSVREPIDPQIAGTCKIQFMRAAPRRSAG